MAISRKQLDKIIEGTELSEDTIMEVLSYVGIHKIGEGLEATMKCYNWGKVEEIIEEDKELVSDIDRIETDLKEYSDEEENSCHCVKSVSRTSKMTN